MELLLILCYIVGFYHALKFLFKREMRDFPSISDRENLLGAFVLTIVWPIVILKEVIYYLIKKYSDVIIKHLNR